MDRFLQQFKREFSFLIHDWGILLTVFGGLLFYASLYPQPYLNNLPEQQKIALIDLDHTSASRRMARWIDATPGVKIAHRPNSIAEAETLLVHGEIRGLVVIPANYMKDALLGKSPVIGLAGDANYFLVYGKIIEDAMAAVLTSAAAIRVGTMVIGGAPLDTAAEHWLPVRLNSRPLFNTSMGYLGYVIPAVFVIILHQTLILGTGLLGAGFNQRLSSREEKANGQSAFLILAARFSLMFAIYLVMSLFYMGICFEFYGITRNASHADLLLMLLAFIAATTGLGLLFGVVLPRTEFAAPMVMISSLALVFSAGFVWPLESVPLAIKLASELAPSTSGIQGFLQLNQMGATFQEVFSHWMWLLTLSVLFSRSAWLVLRRRLALSVAEPEAA